MNSEDIQLAVDRALDAAVENGYGEFVQTEMPNVIAADMSEYDAAIENIVTGSFNSEAIKLVPFIENWQKRALN